MIPSNVALVVAHWERPQERRSVQQPGEGQEPPSGQRSEEQLGYSGASRLHLLHHRALITVIPPTATQRTDIPLTATLLTVIRPMDIRPTHRRAMDTQVIPVLPVTSVPRPMDTPAALDTRPTLVRRATVHQSTWRSRITSVLPAMKTRGTWEKPRCRRLRAMNTGARLLLPLTPFSVIAFRSSSSLARRA